MREEAGVEAHCPGLLGPSKPRSNKAEGSLGIELLLERPNFSSRTAYIPVGSRHFSKVWRVFMELVGPSFFNLLLLQTQVTRQFRPAGPGT